jgi:chorismate mutase
MRVYLAPLALLAASSAAAAPESLAEVRAVLATMQRGILYSTLARAALPVTADARSDEAAAVRSAFQLSGLDAPAPFVGSPAYPFISVARTPAVAQRWGDNRGNSTGVSLLDAYYDELLNATARSPPAPFTNSAPLAAHASAQLLTLCAVRISKGNDVALSKLAAAPRTFCPLLVSPAPNATAIREALTVPAQEAAVLASVGAQAALWSSAANMSAPLDAPSVNASTPSAVVPERVQQLFSE